MPVGLKTLRQTLEYYYYMDIDSVPAHGIYWNAENPIAHCASVAQLSTTFSLAVCAMGHFCPPLRGEFEEAH